MLHLYENTWSKPQRHVKNAKFELFRINWYTASVGYVKKTEMSLIESQKSLKFPIISAFTLTIHDNLP